MHLSLRFLKLILWLWVMTVVFGTMYASGQHILRTSANDAQVELAEESVASLDKGAQAASVLPPGPSVELRDSLRSFVLVYDDSDSQLASNVRLDGSVVDVPAGVLEHARTVTDHRITWEPANGVRSDIVVKHFSNAAQSGFVVAGKSLREVEKHEDQLGVLYGLSWVVVVVPLSLYVWFTTDPDARLHIRKQPGKKSKK